METLLLLPRIFNGEDWVTKFDADPKLAILHSSYLNENVNSKLDDIKKITCKV